MTEPRTLQREQEHHKQAFEIYFGLGAKRSYKEVARQLGLSVSAIRLMARSFNWSSRIENRDAAIARQAADNVIGPAVANATRKRKMVELALMKVIKAINSDKVKVQIGDLDRLLRLQAFLDGDGVVLTAEALRLRPTLEVIGAILEWYRLLDDEELNLVIAEAERYGAKPGADSAPPASPPSSAVVEGENGAESAAAGAETA